jgi:hypothetical protein
MNSDSDAIEQLIMFTQIFISPLRIDNQIDMIKLLRTIFDDDLGTTSLDSLVRDQYTTFSDALIFFLYYGLSEHHTIIKEDAISTRDLIVRDDDNLTEVFKQYGEKIESNDVETMMSRLFEIEVPMVLPIDAQALAANYELISSKGFPQYLSHLGDGDRESLVFDEEDNHLDSDDHRSTLLGDVDDLDIGLDGKVKIDPIPMSSDGGVESTIIEDEIEFVEKPISQDEFKLLSEVGETTLSVEDCRAFISDLISNGIATGDLLKKCLDFTRKIVSSNTVKLLITEQTRLQAKLKQLNTREVDLFLYSDLILKQDMLSWSVINVDLKQGWVLNKPDEIYGEVTINDGLTLKFHEILNLILASTEMSKLGKQVVLNYINWVIFYDVTQGEFFDVDKLLIMEDISNGFEYTSYVPPIPSSSFILSHYISLWDGLRWSGFTVLPDFLLALFDDDYTIERYEQINDDVKVAKQACIKALRALVDSKTS